jgi:DNA repair protein RAD50
LYKKIEDRYRVKNIEFETTLMAVTDLDSYHIALDNALQRFHTLRIADINKIIKDMWQLIYRGEDIDMIEIVSGAEDSAGGNKANRSYNYRVVMRKGDVPLDMRGRCSAGQRVMASIVIRLALAETLCLDCGMLCLDEPTTNLDDANKAGLAYALSRIIASRSSQQNFQLICITHDEDFVRMISEQLATVADFRLPEYYFRISRQQMDNEEDGALVGGGANGQAKYFSHIEKIPWDDMV